MQSLATVALMLSLLGAEPSADPVLAKARAHVQDARKAFEKRKYAVALKEFQAAQDLKPAPMLWFNIGKCHEKLNDPAGALRAFRTYLLEAPQAPDRKQVQGSIRRMEQLLRAKGVQQLLVLAKPPGATATIAGKGSKPVPATFELRPGTHTVTISLAGHEAATKQVTVTAKGSAQLEVFLRAAEPVPPPPSPVVAVAPPVEQPKAPVSTPPVKPDPPPVKPPATVAAATPPITPDPPRQGSTDLTARPPSPANLIPIVPPGPLTGSPARRGGHTWTWIAGGVTILGAGAGVGFGLSANNARDTLLGSMHTEAEANALYGRARSSALYANVGYGAAAAAGVAAVILFFMEGSPSGERAVTASGSPSAVFAF